MAIVYISVDEAGEVGELPRTNKMISTDSLSVISTAGYLNRNNTSGRQIFPTDIWHVQYSYTGNSFAQQAGFGTGTFGIFTTSISTGGVITLTEWVNSGDVLLPVVSGDFAVFNGTSGQIKDAGYLPSDNTKTNVVMSSGAITLNHVAQFADTAGTVKDGGVLGTAAAKAASDNTKATLASVSAAPVSGNVTKFSDTSGTVADAGYAAANVQLSALSNPDAISDLIWIDVPLAASALASGGTVPIQAGSGAKQYKVRNILMNYSASGLSGGGGDRLIQITDGITVYNNAGITAALLGTPINTVWGGTGNPLPGTVAMFTSTAAGVTLYAHYAGGTTDYTTGSVLISVLVQRVV